MVQRNPRVARNPWVPTAWVNYRGNTQLYKAMYGWYWFLHWGQYWLSKQTTASYLLSSFTLHSLSLTKVFWINCTLFCFIVSNHFKHNTLLDQITAFHSNTKPLQQLQSINSSYVWILFSYSHKYVQTLNLFQFYIYTVCVRYFNHR